MTRALAGDRCRMGMRHGSRCEQLATADSACKALLSSQRQGSAQRRRRPRTCIVCHESDTPGRMLRLVAGPEGQVVPDLAGRAFGRGAWVHTDPGCLGRLDPERLGRCLRTAISTSVSDLLLNLRVAAERRLEGLLATAQRTGLLAAGATAARHAFDQGRAKLVLVAADAQSSADARWLNEAERSGQVVGFGDRLTLGRLARREQVAVAAVLDDRIASSIRRAIGLLRWAASQGDQIQAPREASMEDG